MKRLSPSLLVVLCLAPSARAQLHCPEPLVRLGDVRSGASLARPFSFANRGDTDVEITDIRSSCGCLVPRLEKRTYRPGEQGTVTLEVNTLTAAEGTQAWYARLRYRRGADEGELELGVAATLVPTVRVEPAALVLYIDAPIRRELTLTDRRAAPLTITAVETTSPHLGAAHGPMRRDAAGQAVCTITLDVRPDYPEGRREERLIIRTGDADFRELKVPVTVEKRARQAVSASPAEVTVAASGTQPPPSRIVLLRGPEGQAVQVESVEADHPALRCRWAPGPNEMATLKILLDRDRIPAEGLRGVVRVRVSKPVAQTLTIPVTCTFR